MICDVFILHIENKKIILWICDCYLREQILLIHNALIFNLMEEPLSMSDEVKVVAQVGAGVRAGRSICHSLGSLGEASVKHCEDFRLVELLFVAEGKALVLE